MDKVLLLSIKVSSVEKEEFKSGLVDKPWIGILSIATFLELNGYDSIVKDIATDEKSLNKLIELIGVERPKIVGISVFTENIDKVKFISRVIKEIYPETKIVLGGPHASLCPMDCIKSKYVDFVIVKEGEAAFLELTEMISNDWEPRYEIINGLIFKRDNEIIINDNRPFIRDLDLLPIVKRELVSMSGYKGVLNVSSSRGCTGNCIYCAATALSGARYRVRDIRNFYMEVLMLKVLYKDDIDQFFISDDTFTGIVDRVYTFIDLLKEFNLSINWRCESRVDIISKDLIDRMVEGGCIGIQYGIESGSQEVLDKIKKNIDLDKAMDMIDYSYEAGLFVCLSFMIGHYCDTKETMYQTYELIKQLYQKYKTIQLVLSFNTPFPGTWQYTRMENLNMRYTVSKMSELNLAQPVMETDNFTANDQREIYRKAYPYLWYMEKQTISAS